MGAKRTKDRQDRHHPGRGRLRGFGYFRRLGPGFVTGAADDDPAGIGTYSQIGASFRFDLVWTAPLSLPLAVAVQETAARLGLTTGRGLMSLIKGRFPAWVMWVAAVLVVGANVFNIGADLGSMADALRLLVPVPFALLVIVMTAVILALEVFVTYDRYAIVLRWLALSILAYVVELIVVDIDWAAVAAGLVPSFQANAAFVEALVAIFGTTISPYLFLWQAGEEMEEVKAKKITRVDATQIKAMRVDVFSGMSAGILVMFAIMVTAGSTIGAQGAIQIQTADQAAKALEPIAGELSSTLFAVGIVGTGLLAIPTLAGSAAYALSEAFGWREGLGRSVRQAPGFYGVISAAMLLGLLLNFVGINPIRALFLSAILNGLAAPPLILLMLILSRSGKGPREGGWLSTLLVSIALGVMSLAAIAYLVTLVVG
jgi:NRAMP (natural resistance-associated macrophage protein)-like metal ion transporter